jgi:excisionase family DNA binding protein
MSDEAITWKSIKEACVFYGVCRRTIYHWIQDGKVQTRRTPGGQQRIAIDLAQWELRKGA